MKTRAGDDAAGPKVGSREEANASCAEEWDQVFESCENRRELPRGEDAEATDRRIEPGAVALEVRGDRIEPCAIALRGQRRPARGGRKDAEAGVGDELEVFDALLASVGDLDGREAGGHVSDERAVARLSLAPDREIRCARQPFVHLDEVRSTLQERIDGPHSLLRRPDDPGTRGTGVRIRLRAAEHWAGEHEARALGGIGRDGGAPSQQLVEIAAHVSGTGNPQRDERTEIRFAQVHVHVPQPGNQILAASVDLLCARRKLSGVAGNADDFPAADQDGSIWRGGTGADVDDGDVCNGECGLGAIEARGEEKRQDAAASRDSHRENVSLGWSAGWARATACDASFRPAARSRHEH
jgi:hypothetical protein